MSYNWIRASEIGDYVYCRRSWWLRYRLGHAPSNVRRLQAGRDAHRDHGRQWRRALWARRLAYALLFTVVAIFVFRLMSGG